MTLDFTLCLSNLHRQVLNLNLSSTCSLLPNCCRVWYEMYESLSCSPTLFSRSSDSVFCFWPETLHFCILMPLTLCAVHFLTQCCDVLFTWAAPPGVWMLTQKSLNTVNLWIHVYDLSMFGSNYTEIRSGWLIYAILLIKPQQSRWL